MRLTKLPIIMTLATILIGVSLPAKAAEDWIIKQSPHDVKTTADRLVAVIKKAGITLFARIDHQANAQGAGLAMSPSTVIIFGKAEMGTPIMNANPRAAIDLPIKVLVWSENGQTRIGAVSPAALKARHGIEGVDGPFKKMNGALNKLMGVAVAQ